MEKEVFNRSRSPGARAWWGARAEPWAPMVVGATVPARPLPANYSWAQPDLNAALPQKIHRTEHCCIYTCIVYVYIS